MEKIVLAIDAANPNPAALDFACFLGRLTNSRITGVFLENTAAEERPVLELVKESSHSGKEPDTISRQASDGLTVDNHITLFRQSCEEKGVRYTIHRDRGLPGTQIIAESRYADLVVVAAETSLANKFDGIPSEFVKYLLKESECPVVIAPESFEGIDEIIFTFNGSKSSAFAIKQFCYLFPELDERKVTVLEIDDDGLCSAGEKDKFKEWISGHYSSIGYEILKGDAEAELLASLIKKKNVFIVMGAYGRNAISQFFKHSRADILIKAITQALFITHN